MPAPKRSPAKRVTARTTKKSAVAKRSAKRPVKKPAATAKKTTKKVATKKTVTKKATKTYKPRKKNTITESFERQTKNPFSFPTKVSLALVPAINILPINPDALAIGLARYAGTTFLVIGGVFTLLYAHALGFSTFGITQLALVSDATSTAEEAEFVDETTEFPGIAQTDHVPPVVFDVPVAGDLEALVEVVVSVDDAAAVTLHAFHHETASHVTIGAAEQIGDATWHVEWNTTDFPNGAYTLKATVINQFGSYHRSDRESFTIENEVIEPSSAAGAADDQAANVAQTESDSSTESDSQSADTVTQDDGVAEEGRTDAEETERDETATSSISDNETEAATESESADPATPDSAADEVRDTEIEAVETTEDATDSEAEITTEEQVEVATEVETVVDPDVFALNNPPASVTGFETFTLTTPADTRWVELYLSSAQRDTQFYVGRANKRGSGDFSLLWDSTNAPNGTYTLVAKVKFANQIHLVGSVEFRIANNVGQKIDVAIDTTNDIAAGIPKELLPVIEQIAETEPVTVTDAESDQAKEEIAAALATSDLFTAADAPRSVATDDQTAEDFSVQAKSLLRDNEDAINQKLQRLTTAVRAGDAGGVQLVQDDLETTKAELLASADATTEAEKEALAAAVDQKLIDLQLRVEQTERLVKERTAGRASQDSDGDGVSDIDEVTLYNTDPQVADSDGDGFTDGAEVLSGFNPTDASPEAVVLFESPKEVGVVRSDLLEVTAVTPVSDPVSEETPPAAVISGRGLANSFITLYIFSNPTVVTVKTDADGNWSYRFDKEISDGEHEVYVGVTDNAGRIVAKSEPVRFVKTAEAFEPVTNDDAAVVVAQTEPRSDSLVSTTMLLLVASISIAAIGLVLIILGLHLQNKREDEIIEAEVRPTAAV